MNMSIASIQEAVRYWLSTQVFTADVKIKSINFNHDTHFTIEFDRQPDSLPSKVIDP